MRISLYMIICIFCIVPTIFAQTCNPLIPASTPNKQLIDNGDGTVSDVKTGLMWKKCLEGVTGTGCDSGTATFFTWQQALEQPQSVNDSGGFSGHNDWRLPNIKELSSLIEKQCSGPAINLNRFPNVPDNDKCWSSSPHLDTLDAWFVDLSFGFWLPAARYANYHVRLVRGGQ